MHTAASPFPDSNSAFPRDLRNGGPDLAGAGQIYPVDPTAATRLREYWQQQAAAAAQKQKGATSMKSKETIIQELQARQNGKSAAPAPEPAPKTAVSVPNPNRQPEPVISQVDPTAIYPSEVIKAARKQEKAKGRRDLANVFTPEVLAIWHRWHEEDGHTMAWIARHNGLLKVTTQQVSDYLAKYREQLAAAETAISPNPQPNAPSAPPVERAVVEEPQAAAPVEGRETAVSEPDPEPVTEPEETAVFVPLRPENMPPWLDRSWAPPPPPRPGDALGALVQLLNDERVTVKGSVKLNVEIEFGG